MQTPDAPRRTARRFATVLVAFFVVAALAATFLYISARSANTTYYSRGSLAPELVTSWSTTRDGLGLPPANFTDGDTFVIQNTHNMATAAAWSVSGTNSKLQIENGGTLTANHTVTLASATTFQIDNGGTYVHNHTNSPATTFAGTEAFATSSTFDIRNWINNSTAIPAPTGGFGNLTINVATLGGSWQQSGSLTNIKGNLNIQATGGGTNELRFNSNTPATLTVTIGGDLNISGGILNLSNGTSVVTVNLGNNFIQSGGTFTQTGANAGTVNFTGGASSVNFTKTAGTLSPMNMNWSIANGKTVQFNNAFTNASSRTFNINTGGLLLAAATITNNGTFNVFGDFRLTDGGFATGTNFTYGANGILSFTTAGGYTVDGTHVYWPTTSGPQNVNVLFGGITMNAARTVGGLFQYASGVSGAGNLTLNGTSQVNTGGFINTGGSPTYGASSLLKYNIGGNYGRNGEWLPGATSGAGYPHHVQLSNNTSLDLPNSSTTQPFQMAGGLTIDAGSTMNMAGATPLSQPLVVLGSVVNNGALTLSTALGGDIRVGGEWFRDAAATFTPNGRAAIFNGSILQTIQVGGGGTETFNYLVVSGTATVTTDTFFGVTNVVVNGTSGEVLQLLGGNFALVSGTTLTLSGNGGNVLVSGGARSILGQGAVNFTGSKAVISTSGGTLSIGANAVSSPNVNISAAVNFGGVTSLPNSTLSIKSGGFVDTNPPTYGAGSLLEYDNGGTYNASAEFPSTGVVNVSLAGTTQLNLNGDKTVGGTISVGDRIIGSTAATPFSINAATLQLNNGTVNVNNLTTTSATQVSGTGTINVAGNWNAANFFGTSSTVNFNGTGAQTIQTATTFNNLTASNDITLGANTTVDGTLALGAKKITTGANTLSLGNAATATRTTGYVLGTLLKSFNAPANFTFPVGTANGYSPVEANSTMGTGTLSVLAVQQPYAAVSAANSLQRYWTLSGSGITTNLTFNYLDGDVNVTAPVTEADYKVFKFNSPPTLPPAQTLDPDNNKATVNGVNTFSDWTLAADSAVYGSLQFDMSSYSVNEDAGTVTLNVTRTGGSNGAVGVSYTTVDGTATSGAGNDYTGDSGTLSWTDGDSASKPITITINDDTAFEGAHAFNVNITNPTGGAVLGTPNDVPVTINDNDNPPPPSVVYVDDDWVGLANGTDPDGAGPATEMGYDAFPTVQGGIDGVATGGTVNVAAGTYHEDVAVNKPVTLHGAGMNVTTISGPPGGPATTLHVTASNVVINNFTITRDGNSAATWNDSLNTAGIAIQNQSVTGTLIHDNILTGNRTAIDINNSNGHTIRNNSITFNRTGMLMRNQTDSLTVVENFITNNWTVGVLFLDASSGTNSPPQSATRSAFNNNDISGNWYGDIVDRQTGGSLPPPNTSNLKNFRNNWLGTTSPVVTTSDSAEPGYAAQVPVEYGGSATNPGGAPDIAGPASANIKYIPFLLTGTDTNVETTPGRGTNGFQGQQTDRIVWPPNQNGWVIQTSGTATATFVHGPATPPLGVGSGQLSVGANGDDAAQFRQTNFNGMPLSDLTELSYSTYTSNDSTAPPTGDQTVYIILNLDLDGDGSTTPDTLIFFEPEYQHGYTNAVPDQGDNVLNTWQRWDARNGGWWSTTGAAGANPGTDVKPLSAIIAAFPNARILNSASGNIRLVAGFGAGSWDNFVGNVDKVIIGFNASNTTYDFEPLPQLSIDDVTHAEGNSGTTAYDFTVTLSRAVDVPVSFTVATANDTATTPSDYAAVAPTPVTIPAGQTSAPVSVQVNGDVIYEANEQFFVNLSNPTNATITDGQGTGTITNDDPPPTFAIDDVTRAEGNSGLTAFTFTIIKSGATELPSSVDFTTVDGTAQDDVPPTEDNDYQANSGTRTFAPGEITQAITVLVNGDTAFETNETFTVVLSNPSNATVTDGTGLGTITNDDAPPGTLVVNTTADTDDGSCQPSPSTCTLREAINAANLNADASTISFQIPANDARHFYYADDFVAGQVSLFTVTATTEADDSTIVNIDPDWPHSWWSIRPTVAGLPNIINPVNIDGYTQTGASVNTSPTAENAVLRLELNGTLGGAGVDGFRVITRNSTLRGFSINRFPSDGIVLKEDVDASNDGDSNAVRGNFIGTDVSGTLDLGNGAHGVTTEVDNTSHNSDTNTIGGTVPADRNLISGNTGHGILMTSSFGNIIRGNIIGLAADGSTALGNGGAGVEVTSSTIGGDDDDDGTLDGTIGARNVISANGASGVQFVSTGASTVRGNYIGTDASGTLDRGNAGSGINSSGFSKTIGGTEAGAGNLISGNDVHGILLSGGNGNLVFGNFIGTQADGTTALPNGGNGVILTGATIFNTIGGTNAGEANTIAFNGGDGINLDPTAGANNGLRGNIIYSNGTTASHLGIDLGADGVTPNDPQDPDTGPNNLQNFPVLTSATITGSTKKITGTLNSTPNQFFTIDFYSNAACDTSGNGEGQTYIGSVSTDMTDANGNVTFAFNPTALTLGQIITATAVNNLNSTSEFSACIAVVSGVAGDIRFTSATYTVAENVAGGTASITVERVGGADGQITANFSTSDGTATAGQDYTAVTNHTVTFNDGETGTKTINVPILDDNVHEGDETVNLSLSGTTVNIAGRRIPASNLPQNAVLTITDAEDTPAITINDVFVSEPPTAGTSNAVFTVTLSNPSTTPVTVDYQTADGTATAPADYNAVTTTQLTFAPGETSKTITVQVNFDNLTEGNETFTVNLSNPSANATIADGAGLGTITDPVAEGQLLISEFRFRGPTYDAGGGVDGSRDEFVELYNNTDAPLTVSTTDGSAGWTVAALSSDGMSAVPLVTIEAGTVIPARAHYLVANSAQPVNPATGGYSLGGYAAPDKLYLPDIADNSGVAVFTTTTPANFSLGNRLDAAGFSGTTGATAELFREGAGLTSPGANDGEYAFVRKLVTGFPQDTDVNADDFNFVSTDGGSYGGVQSQLGAPAPENKPTSPVQRNGVVKASLIDGTVSSAAPPNRVRSGQIQPGVPNAYGTLSIQRRFKNTLAVPITRLRFRVVDITTLNTPVASSPQADLRVLSSTGVVTNSQGQEVITVEGLTLETPPAQPNGGGLNSSLTAIPPGGMLAPGATIDVQFLLGVEQQGNFRFLVNVEALPGPSTTPTPEQPNLKRGGTKTNGNGKQQ